MRLTDRHTSLERVDSAVTNYVGEVVNPIAKLKM